MASEQKQDKKMTIIIVLLVLMILSSALVIGFLLTRDQSKGDWNIVQAFKKEEEFTLLLDEFVVNLKSETKVKNYLKIQIALMYENEKDGNILYDNTNKIRDIIIGQLRNKTAEEMLDIDKTMEFKQEIINDINVRFKQSIVEDIYFTDLVIQ